MCSGLTESVVAAALSRVGQRVLHVDRLVPVLKLTCVTSWGHRQCVDDNVQ